MLRQTVWPLSSRPYSSPVLVGRACAFGLRVRATSNGLRLCASIGRAACPPPAEASRRAAILELAKRGIHLTQVPMIQTVQDSPRRHGATEMKIRRREIGRSNLLCTRKTGVARIWHRAVAAALPEVRLSLLTPCAKFAQRSLRRRKRAGASQGFSVSPCLRGESSLSLAVRVSHLREMDTPHRH